MARVVRRSCSLTLRRATLAALPGPGAPFVTEECIRSLHSMVWGRSLALAGYIGLIAVANAYAISDETSQVRLMAWQCPRGGSDCDLSGEQSLLVC